jgi:hypothetical protein
VTARLKVPNYAVFSPVMFTAWAAPAIHGRSNLRERGSEQRRQGVLHRYATQERKHRCPVLESKRGLAPCRL